MERAVTKQEKQEIEAYKLYQSHTQTCIYIYIRKWFEPRSNIPWLIGDWSFSGPQWTRWSFSVKVYIHIIWIIKTLESCNLRMQRGKPHTWTYRSYARTGAPFSKVPKTFLPEKIFLKLWPAYSVNLVFSYVVKEIKIKVTAIFHTSRCLRFEDTPRIMSPEMRPKSLGTFEKQAPGPSCSKGGWLHPLAASLCTG